MGVRGLTTYIEHPQHKYFFEKFELHDCNLVIDAGCLVKLTNIGAFNWNNIGKSAVSYCCYNGDYDKYDQIFREFLTALQECNITPYFIFDGPKGSKVSMKRKIQHLKNTTKISPDLVSERISESRRIISKHKSKVRGLVYPLGLKLVFRDIILDLGLNIAVCDSECDNPCAQIAKYLNCPLLGEDSDFYILGSQYIPILAVDFNIKKGIEYTENWRSCRKTENSYKYLCCKLYKFNELLNSLGDPHSNKYLHFILPILLGNDKYSNDIFSKFFQSIGCFKHRGYHFVQQIFSWLKNQTSVEQAIWEIIKCFDTLSEKQNKFDQIEDVISQYIPYVEDSLLIRFKLEPRGHQELLIDFKKLSKKFGLESQNLEQTSNTLESYTFYEKYATCEYPRCFWKILRKNKIVLSTYIDDCTREDANSVSIPILQAIHQILVQDLNKQLTIILRIGDELGEYKSPYKKVLPSITRIDEFTTEEKISCMMDILEFGSSTSKICEGLPDEWHLFLLAILYCKQNICDFDNDMIYTLITNFIVLNYVDIRLTRIYRTREDLPPDPNELHMNSSMQEDFFNMSEKDLKLLLYKLIKFYEMDPNDKGDTFDRSIMHKLSQFNSVFKNLKHLNCLLRYPYQTGRLSKVFNGTFLYNMKKHLKSFGNTKEYFLFLEEFPSIFSTFKFVCNLLEEHGISNLSF